QRLLGGGDFAGHIAGRIFLVFDRKKRFASGPIEQVDESLLGGLGDGVYFLSFALNCGEDGRRGEVAIPYVVMNSLKMPDSFSRVCVESDERVGEEVIAQLVASVKIERGGAGRDVDDSMTRIYCHASPVVGRADILPGIFGPGVVSELAGMGDGVERPGELSGPDAVG